MAPFQKFTYPLLLLCVFMIGINSSSIFFERNSTKMAHNLHYEEFGEVFLASGPWQLVTWVDYQDYLSIYDYLTTKANKLHEICQETTTQSCRKRCIILQNKLITMRNEHDSMSTILGIRKSRVKRFWNDLGDHLLEIEAIKSKSRSTFIDNIAPINMSIYDEKLNELRNSTDEIRSDPDQRRTLFQLNFKEKKSEWLEAAKEMIEKEAQNELNRPDKTVEQIVTAIYNEVKDEESREKKWKQLLTLVERLESDTRELLKFGDHYPGCEFSFFKHLLHLLDRFNDEQSNLVEATQDAKKGVLNPYILTPISLVLLLKHVQYDLPESLTFPIYVTIGNAEKLVKIIKPSVGLYKNKLIFFMDIPLVESDSYTIYQIVNTSKLSTSTELGPNAPFLLVDQGQQEYTLKSIADFRRACESIEPRKYICKDIHEVSEYRDIRTQISKANWTSFYYALASGIIVLVCCVFLLFVYKRICSRRVHNKNPSASKFQIKFTLNKDDSDIRKLVLKDSPPICCNVKRQQTTDSPYESIDESCLRKKWGLNENTSRVVPGTSGNKEDMLVRELRTLQYVRNHY